MTSERKELYRRLEQARRHVGSASDAVTKERMATLVGDLETEIAAVEAKNSDANPEQPFSVARKAREPEKRVEAAAGPDADPPLYLQA